MHGWMETIEKCEYQDFEGPDVAGFVLKMINFMNELVFVLFAIRSGDLRQE